MARYILCTDCNKRLEELAEYYHELYESVEGKSKGEFLCDSCGYPNPIHLGDVCFASVLLPDGNHPNYEFQKPEVWLNDFLVPV